MRSHNRAVLRLFAGLASAVTVLGLMACAVPDAGPQATTPSTASAAVEPLEHEWPQTIRVSLMGDMLPHDSVNQNARTADGYNYTGYFAEVKQIWSTSSLVYCNQEAPSSGALAVTGYPLFNAPPKFADDLHAVGCNAVNLANNHSVDRGQAAAIATREHWNSIAPKLLAGVNSTPEEQLEVSYAEVDGVTFAMVGYTMLSNLGFSDWNVNHTRNDALVRSQMAEARANADIVLVSIHWGVENVNTPNQTQRNYARYLADLGADVIIGTHPHVLQPVEWLERSDGGRTLVWYSLGNMLSSQLTLPQRIGGVGLFDVVVDREQISIKNPIFVPTFMYYYWSPAEQNAGNLLARRDLMLVPLWDAQDALDQARFGTTVDAQYGYVRNALGEVPTIFAGTPSTPSG